MSVVYESYTTGDDSAVTDIYGNTWAAQTFASSTAHNIDYVILRILRVGSPGTIAVSVRATSGGEPTGSDLTYGSIDGDIITDAAAGIYYKINLDPKLRIDASTTYAICIRAASGGAADYIKLRYDSTAAAYSGGQRFSSADGGSTWAASATTDLMFYEYGYLLSKTLYQNVIQRLEQF